MENRKLLVNQIMCPDGTIVASRSTHDFRTCKDLDNKIVCFVDGGTDYIRRGGDCIDMSIYDDDPFEVIRRFYCRLNKGKNGDQPAAWVPLCRMDDEWLENVIKYNIEKDLEEANEYYVKEYIYRKGEKDYFK